MCCFLFLAFWPWAIPVADHFRHAKVHVLRANRCGQDGFVQDALEDLLWNWGLQMGMALFLNKTMENHKIWFQNPVVLAMGDVHQQQWLLIFWEVNTYGTMYMIEHGVSSHFGMKTRVPSSLLCNQYHQRSTLRTCWFSCFCFWIFWTWSLILGDFFLMQLHQDTMIRLDMSEFMEKHTDPQPTGDVGIFGIVKPSNAKKNMGSSCLILNL